MDEFVAIRYAIKPYTGLRGGNENKSVLYECAGRWISWTPWDKEIGLDGDFTLTELEQLVEFIKRNKEF